MNLHEGITIHQWNSRLNTKLFVSVQIFGVTSTPIVDFPSK